ncbi:hypothetical protein NYA10_30000, partial [Burkholderia thailandensis]|nr:hypothetical protein [Burkholderia thailandensis]
RASWCGGAGGAAPGSARGEAGEGLARVRVTDGSGTGVGEPAPARGGGVGTTLAGPTAADDGVDVGTGALRGLTSATYRQGAAPADAHGWTFDDAFNATAVTDAATLTHEPGTHRLAWGGRAVTAFDAASRIASGAWGPPMSAAARTRVALPPPARAKPPAHTALTGPLVPSHPE